MDTKDLNAVQQLHQILNQMSYDLYNIVQDADKTETESNYEFDYDRYHIKVELTEQSNDGSYFYVEVYPKPWPDMSTHDGLRIEHNWSKGKEWREVAETVLHLILVLMRFGY